MIDSAEARTAPGADALAAAPASVARRRCAHCNGPFGLVRRRRAGRQFCSVTCMDGFDDALRRTVQAKARWLDFLERARHARLR